MGLQTDARVVTTLSVVRVLHVGNIDSMQKLFACLPHRGGFQHDGWHQSLWKREHILTKVMCKFDTTYFFYEATSVLGQDGIVWSFVLGGPIL